MFTQGVSPSVSHQGLCPRLSPPTLDTAGQKKGGVEADSNFLVLKDWWRRSLSMICQETGLIVYSDAH